MGVKLKRTTTGLGCFGFTVVKAERLQMGCLVLKVYPLFNGLVSGFQGMPNCIHFSIATASNHSQWRPSLGLACVKAADAG